MANEIQRATIEGVAVKPGAVDKATGLRFGPTVRVILSLPMETGAIRWLMGRVGQVVRVSFEQPQLEMALGRDEDETDLSVPAGTELTTFPR